MTKGDQTGQGPGTPGASKVSATGGTAPSAATNEKVNAGQATANNSSTQNSTASASVSTNQPKVSPKDGQVIAAILKDLGVTDYEPRVIHQLLEFTYRYISGVLEDAQVYSTFSKKKSVDSDDVRLAVQMQLDKMFTSPPPRELLLDMAKNKNSIPLPPIKSHAGPRLPPDRYSLIACNYKMKPATNPSLPQTTHISLPFRQGNAVLRPSGVQLQPGMAANRITITPVRPGQPNIIGIKRKLDDTQ
ncbi:Transcription initiation factor TFIID subunit 9 [Halotydeus destructor]|nr:Transcription initiation factor TFIID subunit 9 [Halotydeus destructor]